MYLKRRRFVAMIEARTMDPSCDLRPRLRCWRLELGAVVAVLLLAACPAVAQNVTVIGPITSGDCAQFNSTTVIKDGGLCIVSGGAAGGVLSGTFPNPSFNTSAFANPTATAGPSAVNGSAVTAMRSDAAPAVQKGTNSQFGLVEGDGTTIDCSATPGICIAKINGILPTPTRAGDIIYWNSSTWVTLPGNNSGTQVLSENASGVPSWSAAGSGSVTSVTCGTGLSGGTFTTTGTCAVSLTSVTNSLGANQALGATNTLTTGPTVAQGTSGKWFASGSANLQDTAGAATFACQLSDGTTVIDSGTVTGDVANRVVHIALSGVISSPAANIRIACKDTTSGSGSFLFNNSGFSKDTTVTAVQIQSWRRSF
jgi:hypothetical protein